jgi:uncharacterized protein (TIGR04255 family)
MNKNSTAPLNKEHAVQEVIFSLQLKEQLAGDSIHRLFSLKEALKDEFPHAEELRQLMFQVNPLQQSANVLGGSMPAGIALKNTQIGSNTFTWSIHAEQNLLVVTCLDYKGWIKTWPKAKAYLETLAEQVIEANSIRAVNLQYTNIFLAKKSDPYNLKDVFNDKSPYLAENIKKAGSLWHQFQGWLEDGAIINHKYLNNLNLATSIKEQNHITAITLLRQAQTDSIIKLDDLDNIMNLLHTDLKKILSDVLSTHMAKEISLMNS